MVIYMYWTQGSKESFPICDSSFDLSIGRSSGFEFGCFNPHPVILPQCSYGLQSDKEAKLYYIYYRCVYVCVYLSYFVYPNRKVPIKMCSDRRGYKAVCPDCKAYGLKKHGLTKSDCVLYIITLVNRVSPRLRSIPGQVVNPRPQRHLLSPTLSQKCIIMYMYMADSDDVIGIRLV